MSTVLENLPLTPALVESALMRGVGLESVGALLELCPSRDVPAQQVIISPQVSERCLYLVLEGELAVYLDGQMQTPLATIKAGACAGEMSLIENHPPGAWVRSTTPCRLLVISESTMWQLVNTSHAFAHNLLIVLSQRLRFDNELIVSSNRIIDQYRRNATTDALTDLKNRYWMRMMFARKMMRAQREGREACMAIVDLDHFKQYNDACGHPQGDEVLQLAATCLRDLFRSTDLIARYGGDEFAVYLPETSLNIALSIGERVRQAIVARLQAFTHDQHQVTMSIGVAEMASDDTLQSLIQRADEALYRAKAQGRNCVCI